MVVVGWTSGALGETGVERHPRTPSCAGTRPHGAVSWTSQFGTAGSDVAMAVAVGPDGAVYVAGQVAGTGQPGATPFYAFVRKYAADGKEVWTRSSAPRARAPPPRPPASPSTAPGRSTSPAGCSAALPGQTAGGQDDAFVRKYDADGTEVWTHQFGGPGHDLATTVTVDAAGDIYVAGQSDLSSGDVGTTVVRKYRPGRRPSCGRAPIGAVNDVTIAVTVDGAGADLSGGRSWPPPSGSTTTPRATTAASRSCASTTPNGTVAWTQQFGAGATDAIVKVAVDSAGTVYVAGHTSRGTATARRTSDRSPSCARSEPTGRRASPGSSPAPDTPRRPRWRPGPAGELYAVGWTRGALPGMTANGPTDAFIGKVRL